MPAIEQGYTRVLGLDGFVHWIARGGDRFTGKAICGASLSLKAVPDTLACPFCVSLMLGGARKEHPLDR